MNGVNDVVEQETQPASDELVNGIEQPTSTAQNDNNSNDEQITTDIAE